MTSEPDIQEIMRAVLEDILHGRVLSFPWYQSWICSETDAEEATDWLPLVYSWNEIVSDNQLRFFSVSVNGGRMAEILVRYLPRTHRDFAATRSTLVRLLARAQDRTLLDLCTQFQMTPRQLSAHLESSLQ
jgi:hypothetical protein